MTSPATPFDPPAGLLPDTVQHQLCRWLFHGHPLPLWLHDAGTRRFLVVNDAAIARYGYSREEFLTLTVEALQPAPEPGAPPAPEIRHRRKDGTVMVVELNTHSFTLENRSVDLVLAVDLTEMKLLQDQVVRAQRMENLGLLAAGIAHDLNNILSPVLMAAPLLRSHVAKPEDHRILDAVEKSAQRGGNLVQQILSFARGHGTEKSLVQPRHIVREVAELARETFPKSIRIETEIAAPLHLVKANPTQLHQILLNLCVNARDAMSKGGTLILRARNESRGPAVAPGVLLEVADTGAGMGPEVAARIWEPFFTTKGAGHGTGIGLATVQNIVREHQGAITVESAPGCGSTFRVWLPAAPEALANGGPGGGSHGAVPIRGDGQLVLVVDDDAGVRELISDVLSEFGYRVLAAADGEQLFHRHAARLPETALVLMDLDLPGQDGLSLARSIQRARPGQRILFISGSTGLQGFVLRSLPPGAPLLKKPFTNESLLAAVQQTLAAPPFAL